MLADSWRRMGCFVYSIVLVFHRQKIKIREASTPRISLIHLKLDYWLIGTPT
jgi:hypothetical protein